MGLVHRFFNVLYYFLAGLFVTITGISLPQTYRHGRLCVNGGDGSVVSVYKYHSFKLFYFTSGLPVTVIKETEEAGVEGRVTAVVTRASPSLKSLPTQLM